MYKLIGLASALAIAASTAALAQTTTTDPVTPATPPAARTTPPAASTIPSPTASAKDIVLTEDQAKAWIDKTVYSSDGKNLGEVSAFTRDGTGKVSEMFVDMGGILGIGETRVRLMPSEFSLVGDRVVLALTAEQAQALPKVEKK